ncbi:MAG: toxin HicA [Desulfotomaculales bacterium]
MSVARKLYKRLKANPKHVHFEDLRNLLLRAGFKERSPRGGSSHYTYVKGTKILTVPKTTPVKAVYVRKALKLLEGEMEP